MQPFIKSFVELFGNVADTLTVLWNQVLQPLLNWIVQSFAPLIGAAIENVGGFFTALLAAVSTAAQGVTDALNGILEFIQGVFTGDMEKALNGIKDIFKSVFNGIISTVEVAINHIVEGLNGISFDVPDWVPLAGGQHFGFNVSSMKLPRLATGTVVPRQAGEFAAILGDNNREAEVVSPLSTIKQALLEALKEAGAGLGGDIQLMINLDGKVVYENVVKRNRLARKADRKKSAACVRRRTMAFKGWLIKFGNTVLPNKYLEKYKSTPNQRLELDASRDATALLHRQTSPNYKTSLTVPIRKLYLGEKIVVKAIIDAGIVSGGERERKVSVTYWNDEEMDYKSGVFYIADIEYTISHVNERKLDMVYEPFDIQLTEY